MLDELTSRVCPIHATMNTAVAFLTFALKIFSGLIPKIELHSSHAQVMYNWAEPMDNLPKSIHTMVEYMVGMDHRPNSKSILKFSIRSEPIDQMLF